MKIFIPTISFSLLIAGGMFISIASPTYSKPIEDKKTQYNHVLFKSQIDKNDGPDVLIREAFFPAGWKAPRHYHSGNLFIYVIEGEFEVELEGHEKRTYKKGEALEMRAGIEMEAKNPSKTNSLKLAVFQVGSPNAPFVVPVK